MGNGVRTGRWQGLGEASCRLGILVPALLGTFLLTGCTRHFFRKCADQEVSVVLAEKDQYPDWRIEQYHIYPDPRARFADPTNPDRPPTPPDDPAAYKLSPNPQHVQKGCTRLVDGTGYLALLSRWDAENRAAAATEAAARAREDGARPTLDEALATGLPATTQPEDKAPEAGTTPGATSA